MKETISNRIFKMYDNSHGCRFESCSDQQIFWIFTIFIGCGGGVKKHLLKNKIICNCIRSQLLLFLCYFNLPAWQHIHLAMVTDRHNFDNSSHRAFWCCPSCWLQFQSIIQKLKLWKNKHTRDAPRAPSNSLCIVIVNPKRRYGDVSMVLIIDIIDYCNSWMRFNLHSSWRVIEDFCCSVSGLTHFSYLLLTPIECTMHCCITHTIYPYLRMDISVISHINEHKFDYTLNLIQ